MSAAAELNKYGIEKSFNGTSTAGDYYLYSDQCRPDENQVIPALMIVTSTIGMLGNFVVIYIVIILREYNKTVTNLYVVQLAASDFLFMMALPLEADSMVRGTFDLGNGMCKIYQTLRMMSYYASILFLTVMSIDRYLAINHAMSPKAGKLRSKTAVYVVSAAVWSICFASVIPVLIKSQVTKCRCNNDGFSKPNQELFLEAAGNDSYENVKYYGEYDYNYSNGSSIDDYFDSDDLEKELGYTCNFNMAPSITTTIYTNFFGAFVFPLIVIIICYVNIVIRISQPMTTGVKSNASLRAKKKVTTMVVSLVATFVLCWLPYHSYMLARIKGISINKNSCKLFADCVKVLAYFNSALNPFLYTFLGTNFRSRWSEAINKTQLIRPSFGSRTEYSKASRLQRKRSSDDVKTQISMTTKHTIMPLNVVNNKPAAVV